MRFRTRAFLCCFVPFALLLGGSFWLVQRLVQSTVRDGLRTSLRDNHQAVMQIRSKNDLQSSQFLKVAGENAALKAGVQLLLQYPANAEARTTVEDQLRDLCERMGFDLLMVSSPAAPGDRADADRPPLAGVWRTNGGVEPLSSATMAEAKINGGAPSNGNRLSLVNGAAYQIASVPIDQGDTNIGSLSVGELFDLAEFTTPAVLFHDGRVMQSSLHGVAVATLDSALGGCSVTRECEVQLQGTNYLSLPMESSTRDGYALRSLQNVDAAVRPVRLVLQRAFGSVTLGAVIVAFVFSMASAGSIVRPIAKVVEHLKDAEKTGDLAEFRADISPVLEIRGLTESFNRAAASIRQGREDLNHAYVEFVESLANALDARDRYTAGHSQRVSEISCDLAREIGLPAETVQRVRTGALLHDVGKIGVADSVLQKPGKLTAAEFAQIRRHPEIGRRILEGVDGFSEYLAAVELHHENWDGTGYPHGQSGETTPVEARIIHVADAYDAMTSDRPYRRGMEAAEAIAILRKAAGLQFDPLIVEAFCRMSGMAKTEIENAELATLEAA